MAFRYRPFKRCVVERVIFDMHGQAFGFGIERRAFGHSPTFESAVELKAKVVMQASRVRLWWIFKRSGDLEL